MLDGIQPVDLRTAEMAGLVNAVTQSRAIASEPILVAGDLPDTLHTEIRFINENAVPMRVRGEFQPNAALTPSPATLDVLVPSQGDSVETVTVQVGDPASRAADALPPLVFDWAISYLSRELPPFELTGHQQIAVDRLFACPPVGHPVTVDGQLDEWTAFPLVCTQPSQIRIDPQSWTGPDDASFRFATGWDDEFLYIALHVTDEAAVYRPDTYPWNQDGVEVRIDGRPEPARSQGRGEGEFSDMLPIILSPGPTADQTIFFNPEQLPPGVKMACVRTETGHATEIAVPVEWLNQRQGQAWDGFRLNIAVDDFDSAEDSGSQIWWRPDWRSPESYAGSGTFQKTQAP
jgi:hypothetical protein